MFTVTQLAKRCAISRATVLYYEREGLLQPALRSDNGYRWYGEAELARLERILAFRAFGLPITDIIHLLNREGADQPRLLKSHFDKLEQKIAELRKQQKAIVRFLQQPELLEEKMVTKDRWVEIMRAAGLSEEDMQNWHKRFEQMEPQGHQEFLESLGIEPEEIKKIRQH